MTKNKLKNYFKFSLFSLIIAIAMFFSMNYSFVFAVANFSIKHSYAAETSETETEYSYKAELTKEYLFSSAQFNKNNTDSSVSNSINYGKAALESKQNLIDYVTDNKLFYPIVKYNGISTLTESDLVEKDRKSYGEDISTIDKLDDFGGVISTNGYRVAKKNYSADSYYNVEKGTEKADVIYIMVSKSGLTDEQYQQKVQDLTNDLAQLNSALTEYSSNRYVILDSQAANYDAPDYESISKTDEDGIYKTDILPETQAHEINIEDSSYFFYRRKTFTFAENSLYLSTSNSFSLTNNSYYVVETWVYTSGDAEATIEILSSTSSVKLCAQTSQISTNGTWQRVYLFIATNAESTSNVNLNLYYGDANGVTGSKKLSDYGSDADEYLTNKLVGTVAFDDIKIYSINYTDFINYTVNGHNFELPIGDKENTPVNLTPALLATGVQFDSIKNSSSAIYTGEELTGYEFAQYSTVDDMTIVDSYVGRHSKDAFATSNHFDASFDSLAGTETTADLVYEKATDKIDELTFKTYQENTDYNFSYYMPRYSSGTTYLTTDEINKYREKYASDNFAVSVVREDGEFEEYKKIYYDELGNVVKVEDPEDPSKTIDRTDLVRNNTFNTNNKILKIENNTSYDLGVVSPAISVPAHGFYRISVWAYSASEDEEATAYAKLFASVLTKEAMVDGKLLISTGESAKEFTYNGNSTYGWKEIVLYVCGNPTTSQNVYLTLMASKNTTVYFDSIKVEACTYNTFTNATSSKRIDLSTVGYIKTNVSNGSFNSVNVDREDQLATYPYTATNWTIVNKSTSNSSKINGYTTEEVVSGVISTNQNEFNKIIPAYNSKGTYDYYDADTDLSALTEGVDYLLDFNGKAIKTTTVQKLFGNLLTTPTTTDSEISKNIYAVSLPSESNFMMHSSSSISFSSNTVYKLTFNVWFGEGLTGKFSTKLVSSTSIADAKTVAEITLDQSQINTLASKWQTYTIYIRTGNTSQSMPILFNALGGTGALFISDVDYTTISATTDGNITISADQKFETEYANAAKRAGGFDYIDGTTSKIVRFVDFKNSDFSNHSTIANEDTNLYEAYGYSLETLGSSASYSQGVLGIADLQTGFKFDDAVVGQVSHGEVIKNALVILNDGDKYSLANNNYSNQLSSSKYFKVTVDVLTKEDMSENGLDIIANGFDVQFDNISASSTEWTTYTFLLRTGTNNIANFSLSYALGQKKDSQAGWAMISNMQLTELKEEEYKTESAAAEGNDKVIVKSLAKEESSDEEESKKSSSNFSWQTFFLVFSSVLLVGALVVALVAVIIKRNRKKKPVVVENADKTKPQGGIE